MSDVAPLRVWERRLEHNEPEFEIPLRFRVVPGTWPQIRLTEAEGTPTDVSASAYELAIRCDPGERGSLEVELAGHRFAIRGRGLDLGDGRTTALDRGVIFLTVFIGPEDASVLVGGGPALPLAPPTRAADAAASPVTENVSGFRVASSPPDVGRGRIGGDLVVHDAVLYGLRETVSTVYRNAAALDVDPGELFWGSDRFRVNDGTVAEVGGDDLPALVTDRRTIVSPVRVVEEFAWRDNEFGDMTRVVDRDELWRSGVEPGRFPELTTRFRSVDAAFELALETFQRNSSGEFSLPGQAGMWSAGYFQGPGQGFGVWRRDTSHIALRSGNLLDPAVARASLAHIVDAGFDNGSDGAALPAPAIWDHLLATGDETLVSESWPALTRLASELDERFDDARGLVAAPQSTSNDCFDEPEVGGFALSTEVYAMESYAALARMAELPTVADVRAAEWRGRAVHMRRRILEEYWNDERGFYTSGPRGSESFAKGYWETSGAEAVAWGFLGDHPERTRSMLARMSEVAMSEFGIVLFPYREQENHFCGSVWYCWQAGIARAAARVGNAALVHQLVAQQARTVVRNKTFYEVTDAVTGHSWRWPGQLWHAAGFASLLLFGVFGIRYDSAGMTFTPAVSPSFDGARLDGLRYRSAVLDIEIRGHGAHYTATMDGAPIESVPAHTVGRHSIVLTVR